MTQIPRWTTASSNCLGYAPDDGELVKFEDHEAEVNREVNRLRAALEQIRNHPSVSGYSEVFRIADDALKGEA